MAVQIIDGKALAANLQEAIQAETAAWAARGRVPGLTVVLVGEDPASVVYTRNKQRTAERLGFKSELVRLPASTTEAELLREVERLNADPTVHGILVQAPLPDQINEQKIFAAIDPAKDVDGFNPVNVGRLWLGRSGLFPCTPLGVMEMLRATGIEPAGKRAVVVGRSNIVGKPMAALLVRAHATVTICHSRTANLAEVCRSAEILVVAMGKREFITGDYVGEGAAVIDVGIHVVPGTRNKLAGDVHFASAAERAGWITPVPGGVGPMTIAMLMKNTLDAAKAIWG